MYLNQSKQKVVQMLCRNTAVFILLPISLLIYDCAIFSSSFIFTLITHGSHPCFLIWICQHLKVNAPEIRAGKGIRKQKNLLGVRGKKPIFLACKWSWKGYQERITEQRMPSGIHVCLYVQLMNQKLVTSDEMTLSEPETVQFLILKDSGKSNTETSRILKNYSTDNLSPNHWHHLESTIFP
jgi:hypothetical protein